jgi:cytochrome b subunit of formate dehydrogenase
MLSYGVNPYVEEGFGDTYHGKLFDVLNTGKEFAVCTDCHGHHDILEPEDPASSVSRNRLLETCKECHEDATEDFVRYISHPKRPNPDELAAAVAAANRPEKILRVGLDPVDLVPVGPPGGSKGMTAFLHGADVFMKILFASVMTFFGLHTFLWFFRGVRQKHRPDVKYIKRFNRFERMLHIMVNISFLALAFTGLPQTYSHTPMGRWILENIMDLETAQVVHYWAAILTGLYFVLHLAQVAVNLRKKGWRHVLTGPNSLVPRWKDVLDFIGHVRWFLRGGEKPKFGRWTYWEKFDYLAVFWGVAVIGISGLIRWQEEFFGNLFGGEFVSLATTIHREEALLATAFIFVVHFFNTHMRTEKFPMDVCVYTGVIPEEELKEERPEQWELLVDSGELDSLRTGAKPTITVLLSTIWGGLALATGLFLLVLILLGALKG